MHNFNFPVINFTQEFDKNIFRGAILIPYHCEKEQIKINNKVLSKLLKKSDNALELLSAKPNHFVSFFDNKTLYAFVNVDLDNIEKSLVNAIKKIPDTYLDIEVYLADYPIYDKLLVSKLAFELKTPWSAKSTIDEKNSQNIYFITSKKQKYLTEHGINLAYSQSITQQMVNMPSNYLTPSYFAEFIEQIIIENNLQDKIKVKIHNKKEIEKLKMGSFLAVAKGSVEEPKLIVLEYSQGKSKDSPVVLVGKGLTFDSGGISLKPSNGMGDMKGDMAGAATALSSIIYAAKCNLPLNLVAIAACCENMPSGNAVKPGDVITAMNGTTIEVVDTDAEGRLVLADALEFSKSFKGKYTIDMATLTGACIVALGHIHTGLFTQDEKLAEQLISSGKNIQDVAWQLPLDDAHEDMLESSVADISNLCLGKGAGAQNGAVFLQRFAPEKGWCHLDIAGTSASKGQGATSRPMAMISEFLDRQVK